MNQSQTPDNCPYCGSKPYSDDDGYSCGTEVLPEWGTSRTGICYQTQISKLNNEVARLRKENDEYKLSEAALSEQLKISDDWLKQARNEVARLRELLNRNGDELNTTDK